MVTHSELYALLLLIVEIITLVILAMNIKKK